MLTDRAYAGYDDAGRLQRFTARAVAAAGQSGYLHVGDVVHRMYNGQRNENLADLVRIWEEDGQIAAWALVSPNHAGFEAQIRPDLRVTQPRLEQTVIEYGECRTREILGRRGSTAGEIYVDAFADDAIRIGHLDRLGWRLGSDTYVLTDRFLADIPEVATAPGYTIRAVQGPEEAEAVGEVHAASFGSTWLPGQYRTLMSTPGYAAERELLAVAPDGSLAGFTVTWWDELNGVGLFEPVGVHPAHRRRGLGRSLLAAGMLHMRDGGLQRALVLYEGENPASGALYRGMGFVPAWRILDYRKPV